VSAVGWAEPTLLAAKVSGVLDGVFLCSEQRGKKLLQQLKDPRKYIQEYPYQSSFFFKDVLMMYAFCGGHPYR